MGDPGGIGPEVICKALKGHVFKKSLNYAVIGSRAAFNALESHMKLKLPARSVSFHETGDEDFDLAAESASNGRLAIKAIAIAADLANRGFIQGIVTGPLNKASARLAEPGFVGHTEFFARASGASKFAMMFVGPKLKLTLATIHVPLRKVSELLTADLIFDKIFLTDEALRRDHGIKKPRIAVCALNPHGRETGEEEDRVILPAIHRAVKAGMNVTGPHPADQIFYPAYQGEYDALIGMYHDQALAPFKMVSFHDGVNVTLGLPYVRTSPDHGTAFDIAWQKKGKADPSSMKAALVLAERLVLARYA